MCDSEYTRHYVGYDLTAYIGLRTLRGPIDPDRSTHMPPASPERRPQSSPMRFFGYMNSGRPVDASAGFYSAPAAGIARA